MNCLHVKLSTEGTKYYEACGIKILRIEILGKLFHMSRAKACMTQVVNDGIYYPLC